jgi:excisionase family DNA binding protein
MTVKQASERIGIRPSRLYQLVATRQIAHYRVGGRLIIHEIAAFLAGCRIAAAPIQAATPLPRLRHITLSRGS